MGMLLGVVIFVVLVKPVLDWLFSVPSHNFLPIG